MGAQTASRLTRQKTVAFDMRPLAASSKVFKGSLAMCVTSGTASGYYLAADSTKTGVVIGKFAEDADNSSGGNGAVLANVEMAYERRLEILDNDTVAPVTIGDREKQCYVLDDHTVTHTSNNAPAGIVYDVVDSKVHVELNKKAIS